VPNLFEKDELEQVLAATRPKAKEVGISEGNRDEVAHARIVTWPSKQKVTLAFYSAIHRSS
jgi:hypothetical protein